MCQCRMIGTCQFIGIGATMGGMSEAQQLVAVSESTRYESLIRLAAAIRSQRGDGELFSLLADELRGVVQFDSLAQFDDTSTKVNWRHDAPDVPTCPLAADKEHSVASWVYEQQEPLVVPTVALETRWRPSMERLTSLGLRS